MATGKRRALSPAFGRAALVALLWVLAAAACVGPGSGPYEATFDRPGRWGTGNSDEAEGRVDGGVYDLLVKTGYGLYMATAGESFGQGVYEVQATQLDGPLNNGYGMVLRVDNDANDFYAFEVSGDGYVWIGFCRAYCKDEAVALVGGDWFRSDAVTPGLYATNRLRVVAEGALMTFYVNDVRVGRTSNDRLTAGDIGVMVETLGEGGVRVAFDDFKVTPR
jgi:hypothetical protein